MTKFQWQFYRLPIPYGYSYHSPDSWVQAQPQIEGYEILGKLGEAGQGQIWRALQVSTNRQVALKVPIAGLISSEKALARFEREVELAAALKHPNIAQIHDSGIHQGIYYYAMDLIEGMQLDEYVKQHNLNFRQILEPYCPETLRARSYVRNAPPL
ncbi:MAG TPA: protein kinase [Sedimentisphaerales bacterium]|nr:protein kinase [Sedimentisphaerales bacterium]